MSLLFGGGFVHLPIDRPPFTSLFSPLFQHLSIAVAADITCPCSFWVFANVSLHCCFTELFLFGSDRSYSFTCSVSAGIVTLGMLPLRWEVFDVILVICIPAWWHRLLTRTGFHPSLLPRLSGLMSEPQILNRWAILFHLEHLLGSFVFHFLSDWLMHRLSSREQFVARDFILIFDFHIFLLHRRDR